jgi:hypothetical protein
MQISSTMRTTIKEGISMQMANETREKLETYLINADPFLWNTLGNKNKKGRIRELQSMGFLKGYIVGTNATYTRINQDLLVELGVEGILQRIVSPRVKELFQTETLQYFRRCWKQGQTPPLNYLKEHKLYRRHVFTNNETYDDGWPSPPIAGYKEPAFVFVQIDTQHDFVERWTVFAGLWFEEIEPLLPMDSGSSANRK